MKELVRELKQRNISASEQSTLKEIAADNSTSPMDIYQAIREIIAG